MAKEQLDNIKGLLEQINEETEVKNDLFDMKAEFNSRLLAALFQKVISAIDEFNGTIYNKEKDEKNSLAEVLKKLNEVIATVFSEFAKQPPPKIDFKPTVNVNLAPLESMTQTLINLVEKINLKPDNSNTDKLAALITTLVERQLQFLDREAKDDYSDQLKSIGDGVNKKFSEWTARVTKIENGHISEMVIKAK